MRERLHFEVAILASVLLHLLVIGAAQYRDQLARLPALQPVVKLLAALRPAPPPPATPVAQAPAAPTINFLEAPATPPQPPPRRQFMETDPSQVSGEKPRTAEYYSENATVAANPANPTGKTGDTPYLEGTGTKVMSTVDAPLSTGSAGQPSRPSPPVHMAGSPAPPTPPAQPSAPPAAPVARPAPPNATAETPKPPLPMTSPKAETGLKVVQETKVAKLTPPTVEPPPPTPLTMTRPRPPTLPPPVPASPGTGANAGREIAARKSKLTSAGTAKIGIAAFNVAESPFGAYDKMVVRAVQSRWYALIEQNSLYERAGQVTLRFHLLEDGTIQAMEVKENTAGQVLALFCEKAVLDSAPFAPLPTELRVLIGKEPREVNFTFYY